MTELSVDNLACLRGERAVFADLAFEVAGGGALVLEGPNGSGKSSLLRILAGLLAPALGRVCWQGADIRSDREAHRARLHYVGHHDAVKPVLTATENLRAWAHLRGPVDREKVAAAIDRLGLTRVAEAPGRWLSAGQKRRLGLARLLAAPAPLWLLDEPTVALDVSAVTVLEEMMHDHRAQGGLVIAATHTPLDLPQARHLNVSEYIPAPDWGDPEDAP